MTGASEKILGVYCERGLDAGFWAEPANALTNLGFVIAGAVALVRSRGDGAVALLALVTTAIGVGSFLFHTLASRWAMVADVAPIQAFIALYFLFAMRRFFGLGAITAAGATLAFMTTAAVVASLAPPVEPWRGFGGYLGGLVGLVGVAAALFIRSGLRDPTARALSGVAGLFLVSLVFRTADGAACASVPTGTHPLWHLCNAVVLFTLMAILRRTPPRIRPNRHVR